MRNIFLRHEDTSGKQLPDGELEFSKFGPEGFVIKLQVPVGNEYAWKFLQDVQQIMHYMSHGETVQDVEKGLKLVSDMECYFTHWRHENKLVPKRDLVEQERNYAKN